jgi:serine/threonine-protein kinase
VSYRELNEAAAAKYRPLARLGQGGMAQVFLAIASGPVGFSKLVVIKEIRDEYADDPDFVTMFLDEARLAARLNHPNVVQTTEVGVDGTRYYLCMEYLEGQPLNRIFGRLRGNELTRGMKVRIVIDTLAGLHHAHEVCDLDGTPLQVVHRDATPHNVFLTYEGQVKVVDFGIAKALSSSTETRTGVLKGKVNYMAPEQAQGERVDRRADVFSVGMILWEVLAGHRPFRRMPDVAVMNKIIRGDIPSPRSVDPGIPASLEAICMKALALRREDRFETAAEMAAALELALDALDMRGSVRDAGKVIAREFADDREATKRLIEAQVALIARASDGRPRRPSALPVVDYENPATQELVAAPPPPLPRASTPPPSLSFKAAAPQATGHSAPETQREEEKQASSLTATFSGRSQAPPPPTSAPRSRRTGPVVVGLAFAAITGVAIYALGTGTRSTGPATAPTTATAAATTRSITVDSMPQGATVREGDVELGTTPMVLKLDLSAPTQRRLVMTLAGYAPHTFLPTPDDVRIQVPLAPLAPQAAPSPATAAASTPASAPPARQPRPRAPARPAGDDINIAR